MFYLLYQKNLSIHYIMLSTEYQLSCTIVLLYHIIGYSSANCPVLYTLTESMLKLKRKKEGILLKKKQLRNATVFTLLSILYPVYLFATKDPESVATISLILALFFPIVGVIYGLNVNDSRFKWIFVIINIFILGLFANYTLQILF